MSLKARIIGTGSYLPTKILSNEDLERMVETSDEWIVTRTGMKERRIAGADEFTSDMGMAAAAKALEDANLGPESIDLILCATLTPDHMTPSTACLIQSRLKAYQASAVDIQAACSGYLYGLATAKAFIESGMYKNVLLIASEKLSSVTNYKDRTTCILFGDGASACVVSSEGKGLAIKEICLGADGCQAQLLVLPAGGSKIPASQKSIDEGLHFIQMDGKETFKHAVRRMEGAAKECLERANLTEKEIKWMVPHQANIRIIEALAKRFELSMDQVFMTVHKYGNTSASSIGIALDELLKENKVEPKDNLLLAAFGGGLTWGAAILTNEEDHG